MSALAALLLATTSPAFALHNIPADVRAWIDRVQGCDHWLGEEPYDAERARQIARNVRELRCTMLDRDERRLRRIHARSPSVIAAIDRAKAGQ